MRVFLSAGEASGDAYGAALVREMRHLDPQDDLQFEGIGGPRMRAEGLTLHADTTRWGAISIAQSLAAVPRVFGGYYRAKRQLRKHPKGLFVPIDFGYANIRLARHAKNNGWKVMYFVPPGSWRRDRQGKDLPTITDAIVTPFEWSMEILRKMGANAHWFGHPIKQLLRDSEVRLSVERTSIAILPGSRAHEIAENLPIIAEALFPNGIHTQFDAFMGAPPTQDRPVPPLEFALAPTVDVTAFKRRWESLAGARPEDRFTVGDTAGVLSRARAGIVCSGTATLEAALCRCPMVVVYRVSKAMVMEAKLIGFKRPKYIALPNILLDEPVVPELVQDEATPAAVRAHLDALRADSPARKAQLDACERLDEILGPSDAITRAARVGLELVTPT